MQITVTTTNIIEDPHSHLFRTYTPKIVLFRAERRLHEKVSEGEEHHHIACVGRCTLCFEVALT